MVKFATVKSCCRLGDTKILERAGWHQALVRGCQGVLDADRLTSRKSHGCRAPAAAGTVGTAGGHPDHPDQFSWGLGSFPYPAKRLGAAGGDGGRGGNVCQNC